METIFPHSFTNCPPIPTLDLISLCLLLDFSPAYLPHSFIVRFSYPAKYFHSVINLLLHLSLNISLLTSTIFITTVPFILFSNSKAPFRNCSLCIHYLTS